jgi:hypothetical protein
MPTVSSRCTTQSAPRDNRGAGRPLPRRSGRSTAPDPRLSVSSAKAVSRRAAIVFLSASLVPASTGSSSSARAARISDAVRSPLGVAPNQQVDGAREAAAMGPDRPADHLTGHIGSGDLDHAIFLAAILSPSALATKRGPSQSWGARSRQEHGICEIGHLAAASTGYRFRQSDEEATASISPSASFRETYHLEVVDVIS